MNPKYVSERWPHGWTICKPSGERGVPMEAMSECLRLFGKRHLLFIGIPHHLKVTGKSTRCMMAIATKKDGDAWIAEIEKSIADVPMPRRWWLGTDVGESSMTIYLTLAVRTRWAPEVEAKDLGLEFGARPRDASDFARCLRLVNGTEGWRARLPEVAARFPETKWPKIIERWDEIAAETPENQSRILHTL